MAGFSPNVADPELRRIIRALDGEVKKLGQRLTDQDALIRRLQSQPAQQTTVVQRVSGGASPTIPGQGPDDILGALLPVNDPPSVGDSLPPGAIIPFGGTSTPDGWLYCDGTSYATADYPDLFAEIGYTWGGAGANFNVPDFRDRYLQGVSADEALGDTFGATDHEINFEHTHDNDTLEADSGGAHTHTVSGTTSSDGAHDHTGTTGLPSTTVNAQTPVAPVTVASDTHTHAISSDGSHTHTVSGTAASNGAHTHTISGATDVNEYTTGGMTDPVDIRPQSAAVRFLIKT